MNESNERWNIDGDCSKCRRSSYCGKPCKAFRTARAEMVRNMILKKTGIGAVMNAVRQSAGV